RRDGGPRIDLVLDGRVRDEVPRGAEGVQRRDAARDQRAEPRGRVRREAAPGGPQAPPERVLRVSLLFFHPLPRRKKDEAWNRAASRKIVRRRGAASLNASPRGPPTSGSSSAP